MATIQRYVDRASSGGDGTTTATSGASAAFASLSSWEANGPFGGTGADDYVVDCYDTTGSTPDTTGVNVNFVTITTGSITIQSGVGAGGRNNGNTFIDSTKYLLDVASSFCILPFVKNITIRGIQMDNSGDNFTSAIRLNSGNLEGLLVEDCRIKTTARSCAGFAGSNPGNLGSCIFRNNVLLSTNGIPLDLAFGTSNGNACTIEIYHNTIYSHGSTVGISTGINFSGANPQIILIKNNVIANTTNPFSLQADSGSLATTTSYNYTDAGTDGTTNEQALPAGAFTAAGTTFAADFSLTQALATGGAVGSITDDITGATRGSPPDAGAYEFADGGGGTTTTVNLTGVSGTGALGTVSLQVSGQTTLTGVSATGAAGTLTVQAGTQVTLAGVSATGGLGTLSFTATASPTLTGVSATGSVGSLTALTGTVVNLTGVSATGSAGSLSVMVADTVTLTGVSATGQAGTLSVVVPSSASANLSGVSATGSAGEVTVTISGVWVKQDPASNTWTLVTPNSTTWTVQ